MNVSTPHDPDETARTLGRIATEAGALLLATRDRGAGRLEKPDGSPATQADLDSEALILARLGEAWPGVPVVAEESPDRRPPGNLFFLVDPLDGTRDFLADGREFSVNIALVQDGRPVAAALAAPGFARIWIAGLGAWGAPFQAPTGEPAWEPIRVRRAPEAGLVALVSSRHGDRDSEACLAALPVAERRSASSALKFGLVASGEADLYVRFAPTMEWDTAAGDHILARAGGAVLVRGGTPPTYGHAERAFLNAPFAAMGDPALASLLLWPPG